MIHTLLIPASDWPRASTLLCPQRQRPNGGDAYLVPGLGYAVFDDYGTWRIYRRYCRVRPGTVVNFRLNDLATALVRTVNPDADAVYDMAIVTGIRSNGGDTDVPDDLINQAVRLWTQLPAPVAQR